MPTTVTPSTLQESASGAPSATCLCMVTPDGQRTMRTCLGASLELTRLGQLPSGWATGVSLVHCEGYCLYRPAFTREVSQGLTAMRYSVTAAYDAVTLA